MAKTNHTPEPWVIHEVRSTYFIGTPKNGTTALPDGLEEVVVSIDGRGLNARAEARAEANARLIAAAPEMLALLERGYEDVPDDSESAAEALDWAFTVEALLARIRGEALTDGN